MNKLKEKLMNDARIKGICLEGYNKMRVGDIDALIAYYIANPDWCMERKYPSIEDLTNHFNGIEEKGIFVNTTFDNRLLVDNQVYVFHNCRGTIKTGLNIDKQIIPMLYFGNGCKITVESMDNVRIPIYIFGENEIETKGNGNFRIYKEMLI